MLELTIKLLMAFDVLIALILITLILMQKSKSGGGLGGLAGGGAGAEEILGSGAATVLSKATVIFSIIFLVNTLSLAVMQGHLAPTSGGSVVQEEVEAAASGATSKPAVNPAAKEADGETPAPPAE